MEIKMKAVWIGEVPSTPLGLVWVALSDKGLVAVEWQTSQAEFIHRLEQRGFSPAVYDSKRSAEAARQIAEYLDGARQAFDLPVDWGVMKPFQEQALRLTYAIPFGQVSTYGKIARQMGKPHAARAVGRAEATNPMPLVIPCHRVIGADGELHGYSGPGSIGTKAWLLSLEGRA
jgi:methylated-DNA-[protein]-cysteine S-methyltransferase